VHELFRSRLKFLREIRQVLDLDECEYSLKEQIELVTNGISQPESTVCKEGPLLAGYPNAQRSFSVHVSLSDLAHDFH
jgi:hypothetical protein